MSARMLLSSLALSFVLPAAGCARRSAPYHFRAPLVTSVSAPELRSAPTPRPQPNMVVREVPARPPAGADAPAPRAPVRVEIPSEPLESADGPSLAERLRGAVGREDDATDVAFALAALANIGADVPREIAGAATGPELLALAEARGAFDEAGTPLLGDLVIFDAVVGDEPASLVGVVVSADSQGTVEFLYLQRGVVRRGYANPIRPSLQRDDGGRAVNTFVRGTDGGDPAGTRYLAGELLAGFIRLDRLLN